MPSRDFQPHPQSVHAVRAFVREQLGRACWEAEVVASELATNVIHHARTPFTFTIDVGETVRVSIQDGSSVRPAVRDVLNSVEDPGGYGLRLVQALTSAWGYEDGEDGKTVWAELPLDRGED